MILDLSKGITVLSLFDGMSCGRIALERSGIKVNAYYASEIDKAAIKVSTDNYPDIIRVGDVTKLSYKDGILTTEFGTHNVGTIDLLIGGSPCQDFSMANLRKLGLLGIKSRLFYEYLRLKNETKVKYWLLENVKMETSSKIKLDKYLGVTGKLINSDLVSYQKRPRYYWSNIEYKKPKNLKINFQDYIETNNNHFEQLLASKCKTNVGKWNNGKNLIGSIVNWANVTKATKVYCLLTTQKTSPNSGMVVYKDFCRYLTREELEQAQTVPLGYTKCLTYNQACAVLGNGWTVDVILHIFKGLTLKPIVELFDRPNKYSSIITESKPKKLFSKQSKIAKLVGKCQIK